MSIHPPKPRVFECIHEKIIKNNSIYYKVKWKGIPEMTIESIETIKDKLDLVEKFEKELSKRMSFLEKSYFNPKEVITIEDDDEEEETHKNEKKSASQSQIFKSALQNNNISFSNGHTNQNISDFSSLENSIKISPSLKTFTHDETDFFQENRKENWDSKKKTSGKNSLEIELEEFLKQNKNNETKEPKNDNINCLILNAKINDSNSNTNNFNVNEEEEKNSKNILQDKKTITKKNNSLEKKTLFNPLILNDSNKNKDPFTLNYFLRKPEEIASHTKTAPIKNYFTSFQREKSQTTSQEKSAKPFEKSQKTRKKEDFNKREKIKPNRKQEEKNKKYPLEKKNQNQIDNKSHYFEISCKTTQNANHIIKDNKYSSESYREKYGCYLEKNYYKNKNTHKRDSSEKHEKRSSSKFNEKFSEIPKKPTHKDKDEVSKETLIEKPKLFLESKKSQIDHSNEIPKYFEEIDNLTIEEINKQFGFVPLSKGNLRKDKISSLKSVIIKENNAMFGKVTWKKRKNEDHMAPTILPLNMVKEAAPREMSEFFLQCFEKEIKNNLF